MFPVLFIKFVVVELHGGGAAMDQASSADARPSGALQRPSSSSAFAKRARPAELMMWGYLSFAVVAAMFINAPYVTTAIWVYLVLFALSGFPNATSQIGTSATAQHLCPPQVLGRLSGISVGHWGDWCNDRHYRRWPARRPRLDHPVVQRPSHPLSPVRNRHLLPDHPTGIRRRSGPGVFIDIQKLTNSSPSTLRSSVCARREHRPIRPVEPDDQGPRRGCSIALDVQNARSASAVQHADWQICTGSDSSRRDRCAGGTSASHSTLCA